MKNRLVALAYRRRILLEKIETQRMDVAEISLDLQKPLALADAGLKAVRFIRNHPGVFSRRLCRAAVIARQGHCRPGTEGVAFDVSLPLHPFLRFEIPLLCISPAKCRRNFDETTSQSTKGAGNTRQVAGYGRAPEGAQSWDRSFTIMISG